MRADAPLETSARAPERERDVGRHRDAPAPRSDATVQHHGVEQRGNHHATERRRDRRRRPAATIAAHRRAISRRISRPTSTKNATIRPWLTHS